MTKVEIYPSLFKCKTLIRDHTKLSYQKCFELYLKVIKKHKKYSNIQSS